MNWIVNRFAGLLVAIPILAALASAQAQDATWSTNPGSSDWNTNTNWTPPTAVPTGTASFGSSTTVSINFSANASIAEMLFGAGAPAYFFNLSGTILTITGAGIVNNSSNAPTFINNSGGVTFFNSNTSTAANAIFINNVGGETDFNSTSTVNRSTAGNANITNNGGFTNFFGTSTAGSATITTNLGHTEFFNSSTAGFATINNIGGALQFLNQSSAGNATITNNNGWFTEFRDTGTTANNATITNINGGFTQFDNGSTAGNATINNNGGHTEFFNTSSAVNANITNTNGGFTEFRNTSTAGNATITNSNGGFTNFFDSSTGGQARLIINAGGVLDISFLTSSGMTAGSIEGAGLFNLGSKTLAVGSNNLSTVVSGMIADGGGNGGTGGSLVKVGTGTLTLSGANTYTGGTTLNAGTIVVNNAQALGLGNVTVNGGVLTAEPQPINVKGNYTQGTDGTLQLHVAGKAAGQYDFLNVGGNASLGGTLQLLNLGYKPAAGDQLTLVAAGGTVSGQFGHFVNPFSSGSGFNTVNLVYGKNSVVLEFLQSITPVPPVIITIDFASFALTPNQFAAANLLDAVQLDPRAANLMSFLDQEPFANLPSDFDKISPESLTAFYEISFSGANIQRLILESRLEDIRNQPSATTNTGVYLVDKGGVDGKSIKNPAVLPPTPEKRWDFWSTSFGDFVHVDSDFNARGYKFTTGGINLGIDYRLTDHLVFGLVGNYAHTWSDLRPGSIDVDSARGGLYGTYFNHCFYVYGGIYGGYNSYDSSRRGLQGNANGNSDGAEFSTFVGGGYDFHFGHLAVGPIASLQYTNVYVDDFREKGSLAPLFIHSDSEESLRSDVGFRASYQWQIGKIVVEPFLKATWEHEFKYSALPITAGFADISGPSATFFGPAEGHDSAVLGAGISVSWTPNISTYVSYNGQLGRDRYDSNGVSGGIRISF
jgi:outer membrane autotransporter protein